MRYFLSVILVLLASSGWGAEYTVCASECSETTIQAVFDNNDLSPGDIVEIRADTVGGDKTYTELVTWGANDAGDTNNQVVLRGRTGDNITIDAENTRDGAIYILDIDYVTVSNLTVANGTDRNIELDGITDGIIIDNVTSVGGVTGIWVKVGENIQITDCTINQGTSYMLVFYSPTSSFPVVTGNTFTGTPGSTMTAVVYLRYADGINFSNNNISSVSTNAAVNNYVVRFISTDEITFSGNTFSGCEGGSVDFTDSTLITGANNNISDGEGKTIHFENSSGTISNSTFSSGTGASILGTSVITINDSVFSSSAQSGVTQGDGAILTLNNCQIYSNLGDGVNSNGTGSLTCNRCLSYGNGATDNATSEDGYTAHATSTLNLNHSIAYGNMKSGVAVTEGSSGTIYNCTFYNNTEATNGSGWDSAGDVGIGINATGTWFVNNNITVGHPVEMMITEVAVTGGVSVTSNNNLFYDSLGGTAFDYDGTLYNFANYITASSQDTNSINADPIFTDPASAIFTVQPASPAINAGTKAGTVSFTSTQTDYFDHEYFFTPYDTLNIGADQSYSRAAKRPTHGGVIMGGRW